MNWRLILLLSLFGVAMGLGIVFFLPSNITTILWAIIIVLSGYAIAKRCVHLRFLNGLIAGLLDRLLDTTVHVTFFHAYAVRHADEIELIRQFMPTISPRRLMVLTSPVWGLIFGVAIGLVALLIGVFLKPAQPAEMAQTET
jgi:hypothetical protein